MKTLFKKPKPTIIATFLLALFLSTTLITSIAVPVSAQSTRAIEGSAESTSSNSNGSFIDQATVTAVKKHQMYYWLRGCFTGVDIDKVPANEIDNWEFFVGDNKGEQSQIVGNFFGANKDATWFCDHGDNVETAFNALGVTKPREAFCSLSGARYNNSDKYDKASCIVGAGDKEWDNVSSKDEQRKSFEKNWPLSSINPAQDYLRYYVSFMNQCDAEIQPGTYQAGSADDDDKYQLAVVNYDSTSIQNKLAIGINSNGSQVAIVAEKGGQEYNKGEASDNEDGGVGVFSGDVYPHGEVISCNDAAKKIRDLAPAYLKYIKDNKGKLTEADASTVGGSQKGTGEKTCESEGGPLGWLFCGFIRMMDGAINVLDNAISSLLFIEKDKFDNDSVTAAWSAMRNIALLLLVPMMLFMVIGTAIGVGPFDAYTVKKALPRMVVAVIFIALSLVICQFGVKVSNAVGSGISNLVYSAMPEGHKIENLSDAFDKGDNLLFESLTTATLVGAGLTGALTLGVAASFALVTIVGMLIAFVVLTMRQVLIIMLLVLAPLAILAWIFPGNDKLWNIWKTTYIAMLMMYPIIMLLIVSGRFFAGLV